MNVILHSPLFVVNRKDFCSHLDLPSDSYVLRSEEVKDTKHRKTLYDWTA